MAWVVRQSKQRDPDKERSLECSFPSTSFFSGFKILCVFWARKWILSSRSQGLTEGKHTFLAALLLGDLKILHISFPQFWSLWSLRLGVSSRSGICWKWTFQGDCKGWPHRERVEEQKISLLWVPRSKLVSGVTMVVPRLSQEAAPGHWDQWAWLQHLSAPFPWWPKR